MLRCGALSFRYGGAGTDALRDVSLDLHPGQVLGIAGCSGSGKSTLLRCLAGLERPRAGSLEADGAAFGDAEEFRSAYRARVGLAQQLPERQLFASTVGEDVAFGPRNLGVEEPELSERVAWALGAVGLEADLVGGRSPFSLSGGEARRVAIAGVLALRPRYLLLDEPTAGLDPREADRLLNLVGRLAEDGLGIAIVSHDLDALARTCSRTALMRDGTLVLVGATPEVLGDAAVLRSCGLLPPVGAELAERLRLRGIDVPPDVLSAAGIARALGVRQ